MRGLFDVAVMMPNDAPELTVLLGFAKFDEFVRLKGAWWERMVEGNATPEQEEWWKEQKGRIGMAPSNPINSVRER